MKRQRTLPIARCLIKQNKLRPFFSLSLSPTSFSTSSSSSSASPPSSSSSLFDFLFPFTRSSLSLFSFFLIEIDDRCPQRTHFFFLLHVGSDRFFFFWRSSSFQWILRWLSLAWAKYSSCIDSKFWIKKKKPPPTPPLPLADQNEKKNRKKKRHETKRKAIVEENKGRTRFFCPFLLVFHLLFLRFFCFFRGPNTAQHKSFRLSYSPTDRSPIRFHTFWTARFSSLSLSLFLSFSSVSPFALDLTCSPPPHSHWGMKRKWRRGGGGGSGDGDEEEDSTYWVLLIVVSNRISVQCSVESCVSPF